MPTVGRNGATAHDLVTIIDDNTAVVGIVGLGYVGLPLAVACAKAEIGRAHV